MLDSLVKSEEGNVSSGLEASVPPSATDVSSEWTVSRLVAEEAVHQFYLCEGMPPPKVILWFECPRDGAIAADMMARVKCLGPAAANKQLWEHLDNPRGYKIYDILVGKVRAEIWDRAWEMFAKDIGDQIDLRIRTRLRESTSLHYNIWPDIGPNRVARRPFFRIEADESDWSDEITPDPPWMSQQAQNTETLFRSDDLHDLQFDLGESGVAITHYLDYFSTESGATQSEKQEDLPLHRSLENVRTRSLRQIAKHCDWLWLFEGVCVITDRPVQESRDAVGRLHCENGPALQYRNGNSFFVWHGMEVAEETILSPQRITRKTIELERNSERRRIMIERFGLERYVKEGGFKLAHQLPEDFPNVGLRTAKLWVQTFPFNETLVYADLLNSTAEPDGTTKRYMLRVDPLAYSGDAARQVQAAAASTWRDAEGQQIFTDWRDYAPEYES